MKREILFRGKSRDGWVYGYLVHGTNESAGEVYIFCDEKLDEYGQNLGYEIIPETVGQFTGLYDKNGVRIFEGDYDQNYEVVSWCDRRNGWTMKTYNHPTKEYILCNCYNCDGNYELAEILGEIEIVGSIHDNPEIID